MADLRPRIPSRKRSPLAFFSRLRWIDGRPLLDVIEPYRQHIFSEALFSFLPDGTPRYNLVVAGRGGKNWKSADLILAGFYRLLAWPKAPQGNDVLLVANDEDQANDDLSLAKKLVQANPLMARDLRVLSKSIERLDGGGNMTILPARDVVGQHGKTYGLLGLDEMHGARDYGLLEGLKLDPSRPDALMWITTYDSLIHRPGIPVFDFVQRGKAGDDERMYFSWYSGDYCSDPAFASLPPEQRANPSMASWANPNYLTLQRKRLPTNRFRRLHLNLGGQLEGAFFNGEAVQLVIMTGRRRLPPQHGISYKAFVDMSGGSNDEAALGIAHNDDATGKAVLDVLATQSGRPPFNPRMAVKRFAGVLKEYRLSEVTGDSYAGLTFQADFTEHGVGYRLSPLSKSELYEQLEPRITAGEVELLDDPIMTDQLLGLVMRGSKIDHASGEHDDRINSGAGALWLARARATVSVEQMRVAVEIAEQGQQRTLAHSMAIELGASSTAPWDL